MKFHFPDARDIQHAIVAFVAAFAAAEVGLTGPVTTKALLALIPVAAVAAFRQLFPPK